MKLLCSCKIPVLAVLLTGFGLWPSAHAVADEGGNSTSEEFQIKRQYMHERVDDFYNRLDQMDRDEQARQAAAGEMRKARKEEARIEEKAREEFVKERKAKPPEDPTAFEKELAERRKAYEKTRKEFVHDRDIYEKQKSSFDSIPAEEELGIEPEDNN